MKKYIHITILALSFVSSGCADWLDVSPKSQIKADDLFNDQRGFLSAMSGVYTAMSKNELYGGDANFNIVDAMGQYYNIQKSSHNAYHACNFSFKDATMENKINAMWANYYKQVVNCNYILKYADQKKSVFSKDYYEMTKAEMLGVRAFLHFDIMRLFAPSPKLGLHQPAIPYYTTVTPIASKQLTIEEVYKQIMSDLDEAAELFDQVDPILDANYKVGYDKLSTEDYIGDDGFMYNRQERMNYYAIKALKARVQLYVGKKQEALANALKIIESNPFSLLEEADNAHSDSLVLAANKKEYILSLYVAKMDGYNERYFKYVSESTTTLPITRAKLAEIFESDIYGSSVDYRERICGEVEPDQNFYSTKYRSSAKRIPLIKLGEMYLIASECSGDIKYLQTLREHRALPSLPEGYDIEKEIQKEYRKEFIHEGQYFYFCKRNNFSKIGEVAMDNSKYQFPLPIAEIESGNLINK